MKRIFQASNLIEASIIQGFLEQCGIQVHISGFYLQGGIGELPVSGLVSLWVEDDQFDQARQLLKEYQSQA